MAGTETVCGALIVAMNGAILIYLRHMERAHRERHRRRRAGDRE